VCLLHRNWFTIKSFRDASCFLYRNWYIINICRNQYEIYVCKIYMDIDFVEYKFTK